MDSGTNNRGAADESHRPQLYRELRRRNERRARVYRLLEAQRERHLRIDRVIQALRAGRSRRS